MHNEEAIAKAVKAMTPLVTNETHAWNLWNSLNSSPDFIEAFLRFHGKLPENTEELVDDAVWEELEEALEGPLKLDLNIPQDNREFSELVKRITDRVVERLGESSPGKSYSKDKIEKRDHRA